MGDTNVTPAVEEEAPAPPWFCPQCGNLKGSCQHAEAALAMLGLVEQALGDNIQVPLRGGEMQKGNQVLAALQAVAAYIQAREPADMTAVFGTPPDAPPPDEPEVKLGASDQTQT